MPPEATPARPPLAGCRTYIAIAVAAAMQALKAAGVDIGVDEGAITESVVTLAALIAAAWYRYKATM